ncbi:TRAP transporter substrate-binding protein [Aliikangiella coralliicola]|uniref:TRAP transporter substrate-binding protein n=1 Tax=Aliikangiella coralliicola TaxID=2592383 RepID=A0A545UFU3_9GAMM|nr:TRAP transporter substrate-binding protein [Aliikangiella coralliicola]TQV88315.1 TRAP transporter substrate-binding protein [Aliikangiella coralliicola]
MKRRNFIAAAGAATLLGACGQKQECGDSAGASAQQETIKWNMVTTWPPGFQGLGTGAEHLASLIGELSNGRLKVKVFGAGELVPALQVFDEVSSGSVQMGHGAAYYWKGKLPAASFFSSVPFGLNAQEMNGWLLKGGGLELWQELYAPFNLVPMPAGNTDVQMAGWFNKEINSIDDLKGLKMRIPGLGGEVLKRAGGNPELIAGGEIFSALELGRIDAAEFVGPYNDLAFGFYKAAKYYYYPGWQEPGTTLEAIVNKQALESLPQDLQEIVKTACLIANLDMLAEYTEKNNQALNILVEKHGVQVKRLPQEVLDHLESISEKLVEEQGQANELSKRIYASYKDFKQKANAWKVVSQSL